MVKIAEVVEKCVLCLIPALPRPSPDHRPTIAARKWTRPASNPPGRWGAGQASVPVSPVPRLDRERGTNPLSPPLPCSSRHNEKGRSQQQIGGGMLALLPALALVVARLDARATEALRSTGRWGDAAVREHAASLCVVRLTFTHPVDPLRAVAVDPQPGCLFTGAPYASLNTLEVLVLVRGDVEPLSQGVVSNVAPVLAATPALESLCIRKEEQPIPLQHVRYYDDENSTNNLDRRAILCPSLRSLELHEVNLNPEGFGALSSVTALKLADCRTGGHDASLQEPFAPLP